MNSQEDTINASNKPVNKDKGDKKNMDTSNKQKLKKYYGLIVSTYLIMTGHKRWFIVPMIVYCIDIVCRIYFLVTERTDFAGDTAGLVFAVFGVLISILYWRSGYEPAVSETELPEQKVDIKQ